MCSGNPVELLQASVTREADFVVVGGGMAGTACAMYLASEGEGSLLLAGIPLRLLRRDASGRTG
jgi:glycine/D-amino acid oxidase-like deaminating enzyme